MDTSSIWSKANASDVYTKTPLDNALAAKANKTTTYTKTEVDDAVSTTTNKSDMAVALGGEANASTVYTRGQVDGMIPNLAKTRIMNSHNDATGTRMGEIDKTTLFFALTQVNQSNGRTDHYDEASRHKCWCKEILTFGGNVYAPNIYNKEQVDYIARAKEATQHLQHRPMRLTLVIRELSPVQFFILGRNSQCIHI